jgi:hypothetical protein
LAYSRCRRGGVRGFFSYSLLHGVINYQFLLGTSIFSLTGRTFLRGRPSSEKLFGILRPMLSAKEVFHSLNISRSCSDVYSLRVEHFSFKTNPEPCRGVLTSKFLDRTTPFPFFPFRMSAEFSAIYNSLLMSGREPMRTRGCAPDGAVWAITYRSFGIPTDRYSTPDPMTGDCVGRNPRGFARPFSCPAYLIASYVPDAEKIRSHYTLYHTTVAQIM